MSKFDIFGTQICPWLFASYDSLTGVQRDRRLGHAWVLTGPEGIGKLNLALALANSLLDRNADTPAALNVADATSVIDNLYDSADHHPDLHWIFPDQEKRGSSITVEQIRVMEQALTLTSLHGQSKVVIIDPADVLTTAAANALLKTLEEPTHNTYLFLVSHQPGSLPATIISRCEKLPLPRPARDIALDWLETAPGTTTRDDWADLLALANGSPLYALKLFIEDYLTKNKELEDQFKLISNNKLDPQTVVDQWIKEGVTIPLDWLTRRLQGEIRRQMAGEVALLTPNAGSDCLDNAWERLTLNGLFGRLDATEKLFRQLGSGTNIDLALRALLMTFHPQHLLVR